MLVNISLYWLSCFAIILHFYDVKKNGNIQPVVLFTVFLISPLLPLLALYLIFKKK